MKLKTAQPSQDSSIAKFERMYVKPKAGRTLIVGSQVYKDKEDRRLRYSDVVGVDMLDGPGVDIVMDLEQFEFDIGMFDHVECMSVLEHSRRPWLMADTIERLMKSGSTLFLTVPLVWRIHGYPDDFWRLTPDAVRSIFPNIEWQSLMLASNDLRDGPKIAAMKVDDHPYLARTDTVGFGVKV